jgi:hypothetical protein
VAEQSRDVEKILAAAFGDRPDDEDRGFWEREGRITQVAVGFGRSRSDIKAQLAASADPVEELRSLERKHAKVAVGVRNRADRDELNRRADKNREKHDQTLESESAALRGRRLQMTLGGRLDQALTAALLLTTVSAAKPGGGARGKPESRAPSKALNGLFGVQKDSAGRELTVAEAYRTIIGRLVDQLEREVDVSKRRSLNGSAEAESQEARDQRLLNFEGFASHVVALLDPSLGGPRTIENARFRLGRKRSDGSALERQTAQ